MHNPVVLIVDDKIQFSEGLAENLSNFGFVCLTATTAEEAIRVLSNEQISVILLDINLGVTNGIDLLKKISIDYCKIPVIMITGFASIETAVSSMKMGAIDYIQKPVDLNKLLNILQSLTKRFNMNDSSFTSNYQPNIITQDKSMELMLAKLKQIASTNIPVLITGESGTGKELLAEFIHFHSSRSHLKLEKTNCAAFPESLLDNELFGHEKGAYTGADKPYQGVFERANGSNLFLDEISDMSTSIQAKILRTLQNKEIRRIGGEKTIIIDVRFIFATNQNLKEMIGHKTFREDLFYRINAATIKVPPLRNRQKDIPLLVDFFIKEFCKIHEKQILGIQEKALEKLINYSWPGNIRELRNTIFYAATLTNTQYIKNEDIPHLDKNAEQIFNPIEENEKKIIGESMLRNNSNIKKTAEELRISRNTLYNKLKKYGLLE